jgi:hypothetical protein
VIFPLWRLLIHPLFYQDTKLDQLAVESSDLLTSISWAIRALLGGFQFPYQDAGWLTTKNLVIIAAVFLLGILFFIAIRDKGLPSGEQLSQPDVKGNFRLLAAGILLWGSGYIPIIINLTPNIWGHLSRVNTFAAPGAALLLVTIIKKITDSLTWEKYHSALAINASLVFLILFGAVVHLQVQESAGRSWEDTTGFFQQVFELAPDLAEGTQIYLDLQGENVSPTTHRSLITSPWEPQCIAEVLYDSSVTAFSYRHQHMSVPDFPRLNILGGNIHREFIASSIAPENLVAFAYDQGSRQVSLVEDCTPLFGEEFQSKYHPMDHIIPLEREITSRTLVD